MDNNWPAVAKNFTWARKVWRIMLLLLSREGAAPRVSSFFFKTAVQAVLLFGLDNWVVTPLVGKVLGGVHTQVARRLRGRLTRRTPDGKWIYNLAAMAREEVGLLKMEEYIRQHHSMVTHYIAV